MSDIDRRPYSFSHFGKGIQLEWYQAQYVEELQARIEALEEACRAVVNESNELDTPDGLTFQISHAAMIDVLNVLKGAK